LTRFRALAALVAAALVVAGVQLLGGSPVGAVNAAHDKVVGAVPGSGTPNVTDGRVYAITQVGSTVLIGGSFTQATSANGASTYNQPYVMAFDATTGAVNTAFAPVLDDQVETLLPGPTAGTVYVGGDFNNLNGVKFKGLVLLNVADGSRVTTFKAPAMNGLVETVKRVGNRLYVGGTFSTLGGVAHGGLGTLNATTGALDPFMNSAVSINHSWTAANGGAKAAVGVFKLDVTPDGSRMVAVGNFKKVDGLDRDQIAMWDLTGPTAVVRADWQTHGYEPACYSWAYDTYVRDVDFSPDGSYFVSVATGGGNNTLCDAAVRWETSGSGTDIRPTWVDYAGGDSLLSVAVTGTAVYVGGHQRWLNNPDGNDFANGGAVPRPGLGALDPKTGVPLTWNPGRNPRGAGAYSMYASSAGLWVGSDTDWIGDYDYRRGKIAYFPLAGGAPAASDSVATLPAGVYLGAPQSATSTNVLYRVNAGGSAVLATDSGPDWTDGSGLVAGGNNAGWSPVPTVRPEVPASTPASIFASERWAEQHWSFPLPAGAQVQVRLYFANRCSCTSGVGQRVFNVGINGTGVLSNYDIVGDVGNDTATMKAYSGLTASADGNLHVDFTPVVENPLVNGIEIVRTDLPTPPPSAPGALIEHNFDGSTAGATETIANAPDFTAVRGATLIGSTLYYGKTDSNLYRRTFDGTAFGAEQLVDPYNDPKWSNVSVGGGSSVTFRGVKPSFYAEIPNLTSMFYDGKGNLYYTMFGNSTLFSRAFSPDSGIVHNRRTANPAQLPDITGAFLSGDTLWYVTRADGNLNKVGFSAGSLTGTATAVSGPAIDGVDWRSKSLFLGPQVAPNQAPTAGISVSCAGLACTGDGTSSVDADGTIASYAWNWGDGATSSGDTATHTYGTAGTYTVSLRVVDNDGADSTVTRSVTVAPPAASPIHFRGTAGVNANSSKPTVTVPATVQAGDALALVVSTKTGTTQTAPSGWTAVSSSAGTGALTTVWQKVATATDAGSSVAVTLSELTKVDVRLLAYSGTAASSPVSAVISSDASATTDHPAPTATVSTPGSWVVWVYADKSAGTTTAWTPPPGAVTRATSYGTGTTYLSSLSADLDSSSAIGSVPGPTASTNAASRANEVALVLKPTG
jgi:PKD repeat protein